jgi:hypothetical protein
MNTLVKGKSVHIDDRYLQVELEDGRIIMTPMSWYREFQEATLRQLANYTFICQHTGIEWPELDVQLSIAAMLESRQEQQAA